MQTKAIQTKNKTEIILDGEKIFKMEHRETGFFWI